LVIVGEQTHFAELGSNADWDSDRTSAHAQRLFLACGKQYQLLKKKLAMSRRRNKTKHFWV
jgi:hypothetical protein